jgi:hypothetical protein
MKESRFIAMNLMDIKCTLLLLLSSSSSSFLNTAIIFTYRARHKRKDTSISKKCIKIISYPSIC